MLKSLTLSAALLIGTAAATWAQDPQSGGTLNFVAPYGSSFGTLDIHSTPATQDEFPAKAIHRSLYDWNSAEGKPELELATNVEVSDDGKVFTYTLRDAKFHDGKELTAGDIIYSYQRIAHPDNAFPGARYVSGVVGIDEFVDGSADSISGLKAIDDKTLEISYKEPVAEPGYELMRVNAAIYPEGAAEAADFQTSPVGLGPFKFVENIPGSRITVEKFEDFYEDGKPYLDKINIVLLDDASARDVAFRNQEIDVSVLGPSQYVAYQADDALKDNILEVAEVYTRHVGFNPDYEPFQKKEVRQAINHAINTDLIIERLVKNKAYRATGWLPISSPAYNKDAVPYAYDVEKAKQLLADAGYEDGIEFEITATQNESWGLTIVEAIIPMLADAGIRVTAKPVEASVLAEVVPAGDHQAFMWSNVSGPDPYATMKCFYSETTRAACNYWAFDNAEFDAVFDEATAEADPAKKTALLSQANDIVQEEAPSWFFNYNKAVMAYQPWLHGLQQNATELAIQNYEDLWIDDTAPDSRK
ncbi:ABC transporter substrate-binding protein [Pelagivirga sediminicola]|uniref:ABC transporter substrate-binding protein n=1 Tax=Pelagivirga sediminicola TaxID=2170575 RepID=A0A2T7G3X6_9RHOB|nr:ABC transporter substrate-binding protein [Pelagivirga sediminicola]PVA09134.1 ABC transporter substrate-binding protein [Pelagivirga sediminicola]